MVLFAPVNIWLFVLLLAAASRHARSLAEDAFFHPSVMSVSYYSFEHMFAVYSVSSFIKLLRLKVHFRTLIVIL